MTARENEILEALYDAANQAALAEFLARVVANAEREIRDLRAELTGRVRTVDLLR